MRSSSVRTVAMLAAFGSFVIPAQWGCGNAQPPAHEASSAAEAVRGSIYIKSGKEPEAAKLSNRLVAALTRAGHNVVASEEIDHELSVDVNVNLRESKGLLTVYVDGQPKKNFIAEASLRLNGGDHFLGAENVEYDVSAGPSDENIRTLIAVVTGPPAQRYVTQARQQRKSAIDRQKQAEANEKAAKQREQLVAVQEERNQEDAVWNQVVLSECTSPTQLTGCDSVKVYLVEYPTGRHVVEAKQALNSGVPIIAKLTDERDWSAARTDPCKKPKLSIDCDGVTSYLAAQPVGSHAEEARAMLAQAESKLAALRKTEEQQAKDAEAKAERDAEKAEKALEVEDKAKARKECKKDCVRDCYSYPPGRFELCRDRCIQARCD